MKFKVGDKVRVKKDLVIGNWYGKDIFSIGMKDTLGGVYEVKEIFDFGYKLDYSDTYIYTDEMLETVWCLEEKIVIYRKDNKVIAKYYKGDKTVTAEAKCAPEDEFDFKYGAKLAMDRAIEKMQEEEVGYTWVRCVGYRQNHEFNFIVGKEYKIFDNGKIVNENGFNYQGSYANSSKEETLEFLNKWYIFEEIS